MAPDSSLSERSRLRWKCRRGMQELDVMLQRFLHGGYADLDAERRLAFGDLLDSEDDQLWDWLSGRSSPDLESMKEIVELVRGR